MLSIIRYRQQLANSAMKLRRDIERQGWLTFALNMLMMLTVALAASFILYQLLSR